MPTRHKQSVRDPIALAAEIVEADRTEQISGQKRGRPSVFTCPDCGGTLWQVDTPELVQFRCHVGHTLTGELLFAAQAGQAEDTLWRTIRTLTDQTVLAHQLAAFARSNDQEEAASGFEARAAEAVRQGQALRQVAESTGEAENPETEAGRQRK